MPQLFNVLFAPPVLTPHGFCLSWQPALLWLHAASDLCIAGAYYSIPVALLVVARRRSDLVYPWMLWLFAAFIMACGTTHVLSTVTLWVPAYWLEGLTKAVTAILSITTAALLWPLIPGILAMPSQDELRRVNDRLAASEAQYRTLFTRAPAAMHSIDRHHRIRDVSDAWLALLGYDRDEVLGREIGRFQLTGPAETEHRYCCRNGEALDVILASTEDEQPDGDAEGWRSICVVTDVTARKRAEAALGESQERLRQSEKLTALGQLAGGIAHDFNNILQAVQGGASMIGKRAEDAGLVRRLAAMIEDAAHRGASVSRRLLAFAHREELRAEPLQLAAVLTGLQDLLTHTIGGALSVTLDIAPNLPPLIADRGQLETVLLNLVTNARDAMPYGGPIILQAGLLPAPTFADPVLLDATDTPRLRIAVIDIGTGMDAATLERATEPFFTTKSNGRGTGLGLSLARGFAEQSGGRLCIRSVLGQGTTVELILPAATATAPAPPPAQLRRNFLPRVLIVDDDHSVREIISEQLAEQGFSVLQAEGGSTALSLLDAGERVDVLISDLAMPAMDGVTLIRAAQQRRPGLPALLLTGYAATVDFLPGDASFTTLRKPITARVLAEQALRAAGAMAEL